MRLTARVDYALRAACALAAAETADPGTWSTSDEVAEAEGVPHRFLEAILRDLRRAGVVDSRRGQDGGHRLAADPSAVSLADLIRAVDGPLALVRGTRPENLDYQGASTAPAGRLAGAAGRRAADPRGDHAGPPRGRQAARPRSAVLL